jgi:hypothetical protein
MLHPTRMVAQPNEGRDGALAFVALQGGWKPIALDRLGQLPPSEWFAVR